MISSEELIRLWTVQLYREYENICFHYRLGLRKPVIVLGDLKGKWGTWDPETRTITLATDLVKEHEWNSVLEVLKHEMAHQIVGEVFGLPDHNHGGSFKQACNMLGIDSWASRSIDNLKPVDRAWEENLLSENDHKILRKAEKLLALAGSANEHEALLAMERVRQLYQKYNLEKLTHESEASLVYLIIKTSKKRILAHQSMISQILNNHFFVEIVFSGEYDAKQCTTFKTIELLGRPENVKMAEYVYHFLLGALDRLWEGYKAAAPIKRKARPSFYMGVLSGFNEKLEKSNPRMTLERSEKALINLGDRQLQEYTHYRHPKTTRRYWGTPLRDQQSYHAGKREGHRLNLHKPVCQKGAGQIKLLR
jgi:hypothetical protein